MKTLRSERAYKPSAITKMVKLEVTVMLDAVPGAFHQPEDIMRWITENPYVQEVTMTEEWPYEMSRLRDVFERLKDVKFYFPARPLHHTGFGGGLTVESDEAVVVEATISEARYMLTDGHKITLVPVDTTYAPETFYQLDFVSLTTDRPESYYVTSKGKRITVY